MKKTALFFVLSCFLVLMSSKDAFCNSYLETESNMTNDTTIAPVNGGYSHLKWTGYKIGGQHKGKIEISSGELIFIDKEFKGGSFEIDMNSISNTDIEDEATNKKLVDHLKSADFFGVEKHPTAKFVIDKVINYGTVDENKTTYKVTGKLTLKGITKEMKFLVKILEYDTSYSVAGRIDFDRSDFDIRYGSGTFFEDIGDKVIYDNVQLDLTVSVMKK